VSVLSKLGDFDAESLRCIIYVWKFLMMR
jgi:hypothetical protein